MQQPTSRLSVVVITLNEEANIGRCLQSVKDVADEIIVVDSLSTDRTTEIALSFGATVVEQPFLGYIEQKNFALLKANGDYILSLDADEALSPALIEFLTAEKIRGFSSEAYRFNRLTNYCGQWIRHGTWYPDRKIRLVKAGAYRWRGENPHDKLEGVNGNTDVKNVSLDIEHFSYVSYSDHVLQTNKFTSIAAQAMFNRGRKPSYFKILVNPAWAFFYCFILRRGFLDGWNGYLIARMVALNTFLKYFKLLEFHKERKSLVVSRWQLEDR
jgi:glycosyltransferase involved in cell wall biosynthesis